MIERGARGSHAKRPHMLKRFVEVGNLAGTADAAVPHWFVQLLKRTHDASLFSHRRRRPSDGPPITPRKVFEVEH
jgi:hypothetical protein